MTRKTQSATTRRKFLKQAAGLSAVAAGAPTIVSASAVGRSGSIPPSDRIVMGCVGVGGMGMHDMRAFIKQDDVQMVAVCDVQDRSNFYHGGSVAGYEPAKEFVDKFYADRNKSGAKGTGAKQGCAVYTDFRELIARDDIDAVSVTTPDHWHALVSIAAANSGKDIYCEKPLANSIGEGRAICTAVKNNDRILQVGSHERSGDNARFVAELVRNGRIGKLHTIRVSLPCGEWHHKQVRRCKGFPPQLAVPKGFDFDRWLGPAAAADYTPQRCHFWWRFILAYGGGEMTDRGAHVIDLAQLAAGTDDTGPIKINAEGIATADSLTIPILISVSRMNMQVVYGCWETTRNPAELGLKGPTGGFLCMCMAKNSKRNRGRY